MIEISVEQETNKQIVHVGGSLTVEPAAELKNVIRDALMGQADSVVLLLGAVTAADLSFFQVLCSAHRTAVNSKKTFSVERFQQDALLRVHRMAGFVRRNGCALDKTGSCVFMAMSR
jgi:anti-anti-sigma regulatory factor